MLIRLGHNLAKTCLVKVACCIFGGFILATDCEAQSRKPDKNTPPIVHAGSENTVSPIRIRSDKFDYSKITPLRFTENGIRSRIELRPYLDLPQSLKLHERLSVQIAENRCQMLLTNDPKTQRGLIQALEKAGFSRTASQNPLTEFVLPLPQDLVNFQSAIEQFRTKTTHEKEQLRQRLLLADRSGTIEEQGYLKRAGMWKDGNLYYTGQALDLAVPPAAEDGGYFILIQLESRIAALGLGEGEKAFSRGGRLYLDDAGRLRNEVGWLTGEHAPLAALPPQTQQLTILNDGRCIAANEQGEFFLLGQIPLFKLSKARGDGQVFVAESGYVSAALLAGKDAPWLRPGHLEYPDRSLDEMLKQWEELCLQEQLYTYLLTLPEAQPLKRKTLVFGAELSRSVEHLQALQLKVEVLVGRTIIHLEEQELVSGKIVDALVKVMEGLRKRMEIHRENYLNADRTRDAQGGLNPYRRKQPKLDGEEIVSVPDQTPFNKVLNPEHPDKDAEGYVKLPNVDKGVERSEFNRVANEYLLVREALARLDPYIIFPEPVSLREE